MAAFERIKALKKRFRVLNPTPSIEEMQRFLRKEEQRFPCLGGFQYFRPGLEFGSLAVPLLGQAHVLHFRF